MDEAVSKKLFCWGRLLAWAPWVPAVIGLGYALVGINNSKATGVAALVAGIVELLACRGVATMTICQIAAIVWLLRSFSSTHILRSLIAAASILASGLMLFLVCAFLDWGRHFLEPATSR